MQPVNPPYLLGIDVGTTNLKANLYDVEGNWITGSSRPMRAISPPGHPEWAAYDPDELWNNTVENLRQIASRVARPESIAALAVVGMGEPIIPVDAQGNWLYPAICWFDQRTEPQARWWRQHFGARRMFAITGQPISFFLSLNSIMWIREHEPAIFSQACKWLVVEDYLIFKLTGSYATDYSIASRTMGFDVTRRAWSEEVFAAAGLDRSKMAEVHPSGTPVGTISGSVAALTGLAASTVVATGGHDHGCATLPARVSGEGSILNSTGTTDGIIGVIDAPRLSDEVFEAELPVYPHPLSGKYQVMDGIMFGAVALDWYRDRFGAEAKAIAKQNEETAYDVLLRDAERAEQGARGLFWLPDLRGLPGDLAARGAFVGIRESHTSGDFVRAIVEGICYEIRRHIDQYERLFQTGIERIVVVGGTSRSAFWTQLRADVTGRSVEVLGTTEATSLGGAMLAGMAAGVYADYEAAARLVYRLEREFVPDAERHEHYDRCYRDIYCHLYPSLSGLNAAIARVFPASE